MRSKKNLDYTFRDTQDFEGESLAASGLGEVHLQMGEWDKAMTFHQMDYDLSEKNDDMLGKVTLFITHKSNAERSVMKWC